jgi:hypothetical protein
MPSLFQNPWMLAALAAMLLPPIIEWLFRRRKRQVELPTLRFLLDRREQQKIRRQDRLLLLLRVAAIGLFVAALSRPLWRYDWMAPARQRHVVLLLDSTASMHQQVDVTTSFGLAQKKAAAVLRALPDGTRATVVQLGDRVVSVVEDETDLHTAAAKVESLKAGSGAAPIDAALRWVPEFAAARQIESYELYVFSDFQKYTWLRAPGQSGETLQALAELAGKGEGYLIDVGGRPQFNYLATSLLPDQYVLSAGMPVSFQAVVECRGTPPSEARAVVSFLVDGVKKDVREVTLADQPVAVPFDYRFPDAGEFLVEVVVDGDEHRVDNRCRYLCKVPQDVRVLVLDESAANAVPESTFLSRAIRPPSHPGMEKVSHFDVKTILPARIAYENFADYSTVILCGSANISDPLVHQLERYVADGGSLWMFLGPSVNLYEYNKLLFRDGQGLLPCRLLTLVTPQPDDANAVAAAVPRLGDTDHPAMAQFARMAGNADAAFLRYVSLDFNGSSARTIAQLSDGTPAMIEKQFGQGTVLLMNTTAGPEWTRLPAVFEFPMLVQEVLRYLVGNPDRNVNLEVGQRFDQPVFVSTQHLLLRHPDGTKSRLTPQRRSGADDQFHVVFGDTLDVGLYEIEAIAEVVPRRRFVVNHQPAEGDLARLDEQALSDVVSTRGWTSLGPGTDVAEFASRHHTVTELAPGIMWSLAVLLAVESLLAWRFGRRRGEARA